LSNFYFTEFGILMGQLVAEYRVIFTWVSFVLHLVFLVSVCCVSMEIENVCAAGGGDVSDETFEKTHEYLKWGIQRLEQMICEAQQIPG
jgi:hypothetical protein